MTAGATTGDKASSGSIHHHEGHKHGRKRGYVLQGHSKDSATEKAATESSNGNGNGKSNSGTNSSQKNVSHVPCKFFRQGMCQAGDKCPFSHDVDMERPAVCKYFEKGNCKFGAKCALAHIGPDGRQLNKRSAKSPRTSSKAKDASKPLSYSKEAARDAWELETSKEAREILRSKLNMGASAFTPRSVSMSESTVPFSGSVPTVNSGGGSIFDFQMRSSSMSMVGAGSGPIWSDWPSNASLYEGSAIVDDSGDDEGFEEGLLPSALDDLLTPQERERRSSRTSRNSFESCPPPHTLIPSSSPSQIPPADLWGSRYPQRGPYRFLTSLQASNSSAGSPIGSPKDAITKVSQAGPSTSQPRGVQSSAAGTKHMSEHSGESSGENPTPKTPLGTLPEWSARSIPELIAGPTPPSSMQDRKYSGILEV